MTRDLPRTIFGPSSKHLRFATRSIASVLALSAFGLALPAHADELDDQQASLEAQIAASNQALTGYSAELDAATANVVASRQQLADARATLAKATSDVEAAAAVDAQKASELATAEQNLKNAQQAVAEGQQAVEQQRGKALNDMRTAAQQNTTLMSVGMFFANDTNSSDVSSRIQWASTLYNSNNAELNRLTSVQLQLQNAQTNLAGLEDRARVAREAAAASLSASQDAQAAAAAAEATVNQANAANEAAEAAAAKAVADEQAANAEMQAASDDVASQIRARNERRAAEAAAAAAAAAEADRASAQAAASEAAAIAQGTAPVSSGSLLAMPANGPYTSPYGYRVNPVLGYSEFHDGLDIGAGCGTGLYAAESGTVTFVGWISGWGNRATIEHGIIGGQSIDTGYNHAESFIVSPGQHVERGQLIGYVGTTGLSTGCHLHFHVWVNGNHTDPAAYI